VGAQNAQNWTASTVIGTEPKSLQNEHLFVSGSSGSADATQQRAFAR
jgi:hypothetical protein